MNITLPSAMPPHSASAFLIKFPNSNIFAILLFVSAFMIFIFGILVVHCTITSTDNRPIVATFIIFSCLFSLLILTASVSSKLPTNYLDYNNNYKKINPEFALIRKSDATNGNLYAKSNSNARQFTIYSNNQKIATVTPDGISTSTLSARQYVKLLKYYHKYESVDKISSYSFTVDNNGNLRLRMSTNVHNYVFKFDNDHTTVTTVKY